MDSVINTESKRVSKCAPLLRNRGITYNRRHYTGDARFYSFFDISSRLSTIPGIYCTMNDHGHDFRFFISSDLFLGIMFSETALQLRADFEKQRFESLYYQSYKEISAPLLTISKLLARYTSLSYLYKI